MYAITGYQEIQEKAKDDRIVLFYFSTPSCGVCKSLKPKIEDQAQEHFPRMPLYYVDTEAVPEARGQLSVYTVPAVLVYIDGKEVIREARNFGVMEMGRKIDRYYEMIFGLAGPESKVH